MHIFLVRHAIAVERSDELEDALRPLTARGARRFQKAVSGMARLGMEFDRVLHSPWLRAVMTAELLAPVTRGPRQVTALLADDPGDELMALTAASGGAAVALVGHEPWMADLLALLVTGDTRAAERMPFKKGGLAWLDGEPRRAGMTLRAMLPPKFLRQLGRTSEVEHPGQKHRDHD